jgi:hypothetical protein
VQVELQQKRLKEKKDMMDKMKKIRKGQGGNMDIDPSLCALLGRVLLLAGHYSAVVGWCEDGALAANAGLVNQALGAALKELLVGFQFILS